MKKQLIKKINEAFSSVLPITIIVFLISVVLAPVPINMMMMFLMGAIMLIVGMGFFSLGVDMSMIPMGEGIGAEFAKPKKLWLVILIIFSMGAFITIAEPDLQVLAAQVTAIPNTMLIGAVAVGVGAFLVIAILRILFQISLSKLLIIFYSIVFGVAILAPDIFIPVAFDSGGVTTGPITVPFILALGLGLSSVRSDKTSKEDSFGLVALCSLGPILAVLILSIAFNPTEAKHTETVIPQVETMGDVARWFVHELPEYMKEVAMALIPIVIFFLVFQLFTKRYKGRQLARVAVGFTYTYIGLVLFLTGVSVGFIPVGSLVGSELAALDNNWLLIPIGMVIGYFIVVAEPAVHVLNKQVEQVSMGAISHTAMNLSLSLGVALSLGLSMLRILLRINIFWFLVPGYVISLALSFFVPKIYTGIAFDSGGVASGPMTSTFLLPFAIGASTAAGGNVMTDAFGIVAMVAMTPLIAIQVLGFVSLRKAKKTSMEEPELVIAADEAQFKDDEIIDYD